MAALSTRRTVVLVHAPLVSQDLAFELDRAGWKVVGVQPEDLDLGAIAGLVHEHEPAAFLGINHSPELAWAVTRAGVRYLSWTVDPLPIERIQVIDGTSLDLVWVFLHRSSQVARFQSLGFARVEWLPLAAPEHRFEVAHVGPLEVLPPSFVGSSLLDEIAIFQGSTLEWGWSEDLSKVVQSQLEPLVDLALADADFPGFRPDGGDLPGNLVALAPCPPERTAQAWNAWLSARTRRRRVVGIDAHSLVVYGDGGWIELVGERWKGPLANGRDMTRIYAASLVNIDVPRIHQRDIATLRAFDVAASGGCLLAEPSSDLCRVLEPGREFLAYRDGAELDAHLRDLERHPDLGRMVGAQARTRALSDHRLQQRAERLVEALV